MGYTVGGGENHHKYIYLQLTIHPMGISFYNDSAEFNTYVTEAPTRYPWHRQYIRVENTGAGVIPFLQMGIEVDEDIYETEWVAVPGGSALPSGGSIPAGTAAVPGFRYIAVQMHTARTLADMPTGVIHTSPSSLVLTLTSETTDGTVETLRADLMLEISSIEFYLYAPARHYFEVAWGEDTVFNNLLHMTIRNTSTRMPIYFSNITAFDDLLSFVDDFVDFDYFGDFGEVIQAGMFEIVGFPASGYIAAGDSAAFHIRVVRDAVTPGPGFDYDWDLPHVLFALRHDYSNRRRDEVTLVLDVSPARLVLQPGDYIFIEMYVGEDPRLETPQRTNTRVLHIENEGGGYIFLPETSIGFFTEEGGMYEGDFEILSLRFYDNYGNYWFSPWPVLTTPAALALQSNPWPSAWYRYDTPLFIPNDVMLEITVALTTQAALVVGPHSSILRMDIPGSYYFIRVYADVLPPPFAVHRFDGTVGYAIYEPLIIEFMVYSDPHNYAVDIALVNVGYGPLHWADVYYHFLSSLLNMGGGEFEILQIANHYTLQPGEYVVMQIAATLPASETVGTNRTDTIWLEHIYHLQGGERFISYGFAEFVLNVTPLPPPPYVPGDGNGGNGGNDTNGTPGGNDTPSGNNVQGGNVIRAPLDPPDVSDPPAYYISDDFGRYWSSTHIHRYFGCYGVALVMMPINSRRMHRVVRHRNDTIWYNHVMEISQDVVTWLTPEDVVMVSVRFLSQILMFDVIWHSETRSTTIDIDGRNITFFDGADYMLINGELYPIYNDHGERTPATLISDRIFVPLYAMGQILNMPTRRNYYTNTAYLYHPFRNNFRHYDFEMGIVRVPIGRYSVTRFYRQIDNNRVTYRHSFDITCDVTAWVSAYGATMIPLRFVSYALEMDVHWNREALIATITDRNGTHIQFRPYSTYAIVNGQPFPITNGHGQPIEAVLKQGRIFVPLRTLGEILRLPVTWSAQYAHLYIVHELDCRTAMENRNIFL
jgi:hypothetical protein